MPTGFKKLKYQEDAVLNARKVLEEYGGVFLSDVVGLGKTYMSALLARHLDEPCPSDRAAASAGRTQSRFLAECLPRIWLCAVYPLRIARQAGIIARMRDLRKYATVFIDESHRFRTEDSSPLHLRRKASDCISAHQLRTKGKPTPA